MEPLISGGPEFSGSAYLMTPRYEDFIYRSIGGGRISRTERIQSLWSGYGELARVYLEDHKYGSVILKHIQIPKTPSHPRGWNSDISHKRKLKSYQVESNWYQSYAHLCDAHCPVPKCLGIEKSAHEIFLLMTDLRQSGYTLVKNDCDDSDIYSCLSWLANFHATFLQENVGELWPTGTYWHLETRPEELAALSDSRLKQAATLIDQKLKNCQFQTLVHGDAKLANFCFSSQSSGANVSRVAAVDFQYVGGGCGIKDLAYFLGSCLGDDELQLREQTFLDYYFTELGNAIKKLSREIVYEQLESEWRELYDFACADFYRFLQGWSPGHWKINTYIEQKTNNVIQRLGL